MHAGLCLLRVGFLRELAGVLFEVSIFVNGISEPKVKPDGPGTQHRFLSALRDDQERLQRTC